MMQRRHAFSDGGPRIVVIGAGVAGLSAARHLHRHGFRNVVILEAQDRIGGRVNTIQHGADGGILELGAQWIHGEGDNPLFQLATEQGLVDSETPGAEGRGEYCTQDGGRIQPELVAEVEAVMEAADESCCDFLDDHMQHPKNIIWQSDHLIQHSDDNIRQSGACIRRCEDKIPASVEHHFRAAFLQHLSRQSDNGTESAHQRQLAGLFRWHLVFQCLDNACHRLGRVSAATWGEFHQFEGEHWVNLRSGYDSVVQELASALPDGAIRRNAAVTTVHYGEDEETTKPPIRQLEDTSRNPVPTNGNHVRDDNDEVITGFGQGGRAVRVVCEDGSVHPADHVVVTVSLGVLKKSQKQLFRPALPPAKRRVIEAMGFGTLNKIFLVFERPFWPADCGGYQLVWTDSDQLALCDDDIDGIAECDYEWYKDITGFDVVLNQPNVLMGWIGRRGGEIMESLSDAQVGTTCVDHLRRFTGIQDIPYPQKIIRSSWKTNPRVLGSYSHRTVKCDVDGSHTTDLARPVYVDGSDGCKCPVLLFAGEATDTNYFSTVHGAYMSGEREAKRLISYYEDGKKITS